MKTYLWVTGSVFSLLTAAHVWRIVAENRTLAGDPVFVPITLLSAVLSGWAFYLLLRRTV